MDLIAERGIAAHWSYKHGGEGPNSAQNRAHSWITNLVESQRSTGSSLEFLENVKVDLFPDEVYLFTPKGDILALPRNATALDFAYAVHTDVGNQAVAARIDGKLVPLRSRLASGQRVEIVIAKSSRLEALLADIALGNRMPQQVAQTLAREAPGKAKRRAQDRPLPIADKILITGAERGVIGFANCCLPVPGDEVMGYHTTGKGIVVHRVDCPNVAEYRKSPDRWVDIGWDRHVTGDFDAALKIEVDNRPGALAQVAAAIAEAESNIDRVEYLERDADMAVLRFSIEVSDRRHLADVIRRVRRLKVVLGVQRM